MVLKPPQKGIACLNRACQELDAILSEIGEGDVEDQYRAFSTACSIFIVLAEWKQAILNAEPDAQRFFMSAKLKVSEVDKSLSFAADKRLITFLDQINSLTTVSELIHIQDQLIRWTLPLLLFANIPDKSFSGLRFLGSNGSIEEAKELETTVVFLKFDIDGEPAKQWNYLKPGISYDLAIEVRVSNWPEGANVLSLVPVTIDLRERDWLPTFRFEKSKEGSPFIYTGIGRVVLKVAHSFGSRPYEFLYAAEFDNKSNYQEVAILGHRRLLLEGSDVVLNPLTGFSNVDRHLLRVRDKLRAFPGLYLDDLANVMIILCGLGNIAAQALKGGLFDAGISEKQFQAKVTEMLRNRSDIGEHLQGHPEAAGGITDFTFRDIPIELKVENGKVLFPKDFSKYFNQTASYAIGLGKRIGVLTVLEATSKTSPIGIVEDDIDVFNHKIGQSQIMIVVVVVRGGFPKPSSYSR